ncbi:hypothetical protein MASR1M31_03500 [Porphyromonadaceae bacterium]
MTYNDDILSKVQSFGILSYSVDKIIDLIDPPHHERFRKEFNTPGSSVYKAYRRGKATGQYSLDKNLFDKATKGADLNSNSELESRFSRNKINDKILENFGL